MAAGGMPVGDNARPVSTRNLWILVDRRIDRAERQQTCVILTRIVAGPQKTAVQQMRKFKGVAAGRRDPAVCI